MLQAGRLLGFWIERSGSGVPDRWLPENSKAQSGVACTQCFDDSEARIIERLVENLLKLWRAPAVVIPLQIHSHFPERPLVATPALNQVKDFVNCLLPSTGRR